MRFGNHKPPGVTLGLNFATTSATAVTSSATANTLGSWVSLGTSPAWRTNRLKIVYRSFSTSNFGTCLLNVGIGASGSQVVVIPNITFSMVGTYHTTLSGITFPCPLPPGTEIWLQTQDSVGNGLHNFSLELDHDPEWENCGPIVPIGIDTATSSGVIISTGANNSLLTTSLFTTPAQAFQGFVAVCTMQSSDYCTLFWRIQTSGGVPLTPYKRFDYNGGTDSTQVMGSFHISPNILPPSVALDLNYQSTGNATGLPVNVAIYGIS